MPGKKNPNWEDIRRRYVIDGEKPSDIAKDYKTTAKYISERASKLNWGKKKQEVAKDLDEKALSFKEELLDLAQWNVLWTMRAVKEARESNLIGLTIQDGEGLPNRFSQEEHKTGLAILSDAETVKKLDLTVTEQVDTRDVNGLSDNELDDEFKRYTGSG